MFSKSTIVWGIASVIALAASYVARAYIRRMREQGIASYAAANGWQAITADDAILGNLLPSVLKDVGQNPTYSDSYKAVANGVPFTFFSYAYEVRAAANSTRRVTLRFFVASFELKQRFDPLYIRRRNYLEATADLSDQQKLTLEGDFNKYFDVYAPKGTQIETLSLLTPDVMAMIEENGRDFDMQVDGHTVSVIGNGDFPNPTKFAEMTRYVASLASELSTKSGVATTVAHGANVASNTPAPRLMRQTLFTSTRGRIVFAVIVLFAGIVLFNIVKAFVTITQALHTSL